MLPLLGFGSEATGGVDELFDVIDTDGNGTLEYAELEAKLRFGEGFVPPVRVKPKWMDDDDGPKSPANHEFVDVRSLLSQYGIAAKGDLVRM